MKKLLLLGVLILSLAANAWLGWRNAELKKQQAVLELSAPKMEEHRPNVLIDTKNFDFSATGLGDAAWKIPEPDKTPPLKPDEAPVINVFDPTPEAGK